MHKVLKKISNNNLKTTLLIFFVTIAVRILFAQTSDFGQIKLMQSRLDSLKLEKIDKDIKKGFYGKVASVVVYSDSNIAFEKYYNGAKPNDLQTTRSGMKSVTALLIGIAIKEKLINSSMTIAEAKKFAASKTVKVEVCPDDSKGLEFHYDSIASYLRKKLATAPDSLIVENVVPGLIAVLEEIKQNRIQHQQARPTLSP